jgi:hypothetical protein
MHAEDALPDHGCDGEEVEGVGNDFPQSRVESAFALIEEAIQFVEFTGLVVAPKQEEGAGVAHFVGEEKEDALQGLLAPIYVVPQEEVVFAGGGAEDAEDGEQVLELSVYVSADLHWSFEFEEHGLFLEDAAGHGAEPFDLVFFEDLKFVCPGGSLADANDNIVDIEHLLLACQHRNRTEFSYTTAIIDPRLLPHHSLTEGQQQPIHSPVARLDPFSIAHSTQPTPTPEALPLCYR